MAPIVIEVSGQSSRTVPAERCTLSVSVSHQSADQTAVHDAVTNASIELSTYLRQTAARDTTTTHDDRPITKWSMGRLSTSTWEQSISADGHRKERLHRARTTFAITFRDFQLLSKLCLDMSTNEYYAIDSMRWHITEETRDSLQTGVRQAALRDAIAKAGDYASVYKEEAAPAQGKLIPVKISDATGATGWGAARPMVAMSRGAAPGASAQPRPALDFHPEDVEVSASVHCVFHFDSKSV